MPSSGFHGYQVHRWCTILQANIHTHKIIIYSKILSSRKVTYEKSFEERRKLRVIQLSNAAQDAYWQIWRSRVDTLVVLVLVPDSPSAHSHESRRLSLAKTSYPDSLSTCRPFLRRLAMRNLSLLSNYYPSKKLDI